MLSLKESMSCTDTGGLEFWHLISGLSSMSGASLPCWIAQSLIVYRGRKACVLSGLQNSPHSACKRLLCQQATHSSK